MMTLLLHYSMSKKKVLAICLLCMSYVCLLIVLALTNETALDRLLYPVETFQSFHDLSLQIMRFVLIAVLATISFDFHSYDDQAMIAYFSVKEVVIKKMIVYGLLIISVAIICNLLRMMIAVICFSFVDFSAMLDSFAIVGDMIILWGWLLLLTPLKYPQTSFIFVIFYMLIYFIQEDLASITVYYMLPFYHEQLSSYLLANYYRLIYLLLLLNIVYVHEIKQAIG